MVIDGSKCFSTITASWGRSQWLSRMGHFSRYLFGMADPERQVSKVQEFTWIRLSRTQ